MTPEYITDEYGDKYELVDDDEDELEWEYMSNAEKLDLIQAHLAQSEGTEADLGAWEERLVGDFIQLQQELGRELTDKEIDILYDNTLQTDEGPSTAYHRIREGNPDSGLLGSAQEITTNSNDRVKLAAQVLDEEDEDQQAPYVDEMFSGGEQ